MKTIVISGVIGYDVSASSIREQLPTGSEKTLIKLNTPGGSVFEAFEMYNMLKDKGKKAKVQIEVTGLAGSAGSYLLLAGNEPPIVRKNSTAMFHRASQLLYANSPKLRQMADVLDAIDDVISDDLAKQTGKDKKELLDLFTNDYWMVGGKAIQASGIPAEYKDDDDGEEEQVSSETEARAKILATVEKMKTENISNKMDLSIFNKYVTKEQEEEEPLKQSLADYLKDNPEAKADIFAFVEKEKPAPDPKAEAARISELLNLSGVKISAELKAAIDEGKTPEAFALAAMKKQNEIANSTNAANLGKPAASAQTPADVMENAKPPAAKTGALVDAEAIRALAKKNGGKK